MELWSAHHSGAGHRLPALAACLALATAATLVAGCSRSPTDQSAEAGFARDMATHHAQAVDMAFMVREVSHDDRLRTLAYDIIATQATQRGMFMGWLQQWGLAQTAAGPRMAWMADAGSSAPGHAMADMKVSGDLPLMAGMASEAELERLRQASGPDAEVLFLQLMIRHHEGGVLMARALVARSTRDEVVTMARSIDSGQMGEIGLMKAMLDERGAHPLPSLLD